MKNRLTAFCLLALMGLCGVRAEDAAKLAKINNYLSVPSGTVGYPVTTVQTTLQSALGTYNASPKADADWATLDAALTAYESSTDVQLPENGKTYYISSDNRNGTYFLYDGGTLGTTLTNLQSDAFKWTCTVTGGKFVFQNVGTSKYLGFKVMSDAAYNFTINVGSRVNIGCLPLYADGAGKYMLVKNDAGTFDHANRAYNKAIENYSSDYFIHEVPTTIDDAETLALANGYLALPTTIGYPTEAVKTALQTAMDTYMSSAKTASDYTALSAAIATYRSGEIAVPENGKTYLIKSDNLNGAYFLHDSGTLSTTLTNGNTDDFLWKCIKTTAGKFTFLNLKTGKYLGYKEVSATAYNFTIDGSKQVNQGCVPLYADGASRYLLVQNNNGAFNQANKTYNKTSDGYTSDYIFEEVNITTLTINTQPSSLCTFTWNGISKTGTSVVFTNTGTVADGTISCTPADATYAASTLVDGSTAVTSWDGAGDATYTQNLVPNFFSSTYGEKWVRIKFARVPANGWTVDNADSYTDATPFNRACDLSDENQLWCMVGTADNFKLYNKGVGDGLALATVDTTPVSGTETKMVAAGSAGSWQLNTDYLNAGTGAGYVFQPAGTANGMGVNSFGGNTGQLKYWNASDDGSHWLIEDASATLQIAAAGVSDLDEMHSHIARFTLNYGSGSAAVTLTSENLGTPKTYYLPSGSTLGASTPTTWLGFEFGQFDCGGTMGTSLSDIALTDDVLITAIFTETNPNVRYLYYDGDGYNAPYRIPAITTAKNGDVIAMNDRRYCGADIGNGHVDIVGRVSTDNGATWGTDMMIMDGTDACGYGDAAIVGDRSSNQVLVMAAAGRITYGASTAANPIKVVRSVGTHNGSTWTWTTPEDVTSRFYTDIFDGNNAKLFFGSGRICQSRIIKVGNYYRLYAALCTGNGNFVVYSDDFGATWNALGGATTSCAPQGDEPKAEELPDGSVLLSSRKYYGRYFNIFTYTDENSATGAWGTVVESNSQTNGISFGANSTNGEIYMAKAFRVSDKKPVTLALQSIPTANSRAAVKIYYKELTDKTTDWATPQIFASDWNTSPYQVTVGNAAYSTMALQHDGKMGFFMEENPHGGNYDMVYLPIDIAAITNGTYTEGFTRSIGTLGYATQWLDYPAYIPEGVSAYYATTEPVDGVLSMPKIETGIIPEKTGVVLKAEAGDYHFIECTEEAQEMENNLMTGAMDDTEITGSSTTSFYALNTDENNVLGLFAPKGAGTPNGSFTLKATKAYLQLTGSLPAKGFTLLLGDNVTGIHTIPQTPKDAAIYDLTGRRILAPKAGKIYIINGQKVLK